MVINKENMTAEISAYEIQQNVLPYLNTIDQNRKNKLTYAATQLGDEIQSKLKAFGKAEQKLTVDYAGKKPDGDFKTNDKGDMIIDSKRLMEYTAKREELALNTLVTLELYYCKDKQLIGELPVIHIKKLNGLLFEYDISELETQQQVNVPTNTEYKA